MKRLMSVLVVSSMMIPAFAEKPAEAAGEEPKKVEAEEETVVKPETGTWPAPIAFAQLPRCPDVVGLRLTIPYSTAQDSVTGFDIGFWGRSVYFEGVQLNILRNDVTDSASAFQLGVYNSIGRADMLGLQVGLWNEAMSLRGLQAGLVNIVGDGRGLQVGLINRAETLYGYQIGLINIIRSAEIQFLPIVNIGF